MKEACCSEKISKLLKEKGFDEPCMAFWEYELSEYSLHISSEFPINNSELEKEKEFKGFSAPTHQMALAWLREKHHLWCEIAPEEKNTWFVEIYSLKMEEYIMDNPAHNIPVYEDAVEVAITYCLENLI